MPRPIPKPNAILVVSFEVDGDGCVVFASDANVEAADVMSGGVEDCVLDVDGVGPYPMTVTVVGKAAYSFAISDRVCHNG